LLASPQGLLIPLPPAFGASRELAAVILAVTGIHPHLGAAMNIKEVPGLAETAALLSLRAAGDLKAGEPPPDLLRHQAGEGREPRSYVLGPDPQTVVEKVLALKNALSAAGKL
jgi:predicted fused transcriptional regulator/phosphomethylpyrimidine kinase